jgi:hypothetical protein
VQTKIQPFGKDYVLDSDLNQINRLSKLAVGFKVVFLGELGIGKILGIRTTTEQPVPPNYLQEHINASYTVGALLQMGIDLATSFISLPIHSRRPVVNLRESLAHECRAL